MGKSIKIRPLGTPRMSLAHKIKTYLRKPRRGHGSWMKLAQVRIQWQLGRSGSEPWGSAARDVIVHWELTEISKERSKILQIHMAIKTSFIA